MTSCVVSAPSSLRSAWCSSPARSAPCSISAVKLDAAHVGDRGAGRADRHGAGQHRQQPPARPRRSRRPDRRSVARHRRPRPPGGRDCRAGSPPWKAASTPAWTGRAARSIRSPPRSANWAGWCARSPKRWPRHAAVLQQQGAVPAPADAGAAPATDGALTSSESDAVERPRRFRSLTREAIVDLIGKAVDANRIDLYLQPIVTLPQRKVRYYEALSRLRTEDGDVITGRRLHRLRRKRRPDAEDRQPAAVPLRAGDAPPAIEEPRRRPVLQCQRLDADRSG